mmetsp:Transcript_65327/g.117574  ORF Transcript_65327/g.117574 Transcript_65327/m.117574 type:complete len:135 (+) Transcript_65327:373-777(+)
MVTLLMPSHRALVSAAAVEQSGEPGMPEIRRWAILVSSLAEEPKVSEDLRQILTAHASEISTPEQLLGVIQVCYCAPTYSDQSLYRVQLQVSSSLDRVFQAVLAACVSLGATVKYRPAPRSAAERLVASYVKQA